MSVEIPICEQHAGILRATYEISDYCPVCKGLRGKPFRTFSYAGSQRMEVDGWTNECGHVDTYSAVRVEAALLNNLYNHRGTFEHAPRQAPRTPNESIQTAIFF